MATTQNPIILDSTIRHQATNFDIIKPEHFLPGLVEGIDIANKNILKIKNEKEPNFKNTIEALEVSCLKAEKVISIFYNLLHADATEEIQKLAKEISPLVADFKTKIYLDSNLFSQVKKVYEQKFDLIQEEQVLLNNTYDDFIRTGALLSETDKNRLKEISKELSLLSPQFQENILKSTSEYKLEVTDKSELGGLSDDNLEAAKTESGWCFTLQSPSFIPFLKYCENRDLRETLWKAFSTRAVTDKESNQEIVKKIVVLRGEQAKLLGYNNYSNYVLEKRMAKNEQTVMEFLNELYTAFEPAAKKDIEDVSQLAFETDQIKNLMPWDVSFYSEKLKSKLYDFNEEDIKPYFSLENVIEGVFTHSEKLYNLTSKKGTDLPLYQKDVVTYEVFDKNSNEYMGLLYMDFFPRDTKAQGAWKCTYVDQGLFESEVQRPHVSIVCNFTKPTKTKPSLLTFREVQTLFHEFGHALHTLLSKCKYKSIGGTHVHRDFVELPSQIFENWILETEALNLFAKHYETGEPIPSEYIDKIKKSSQFMSGYFNFRQLKFGFLDMAWHSTEFKSLDEIDVIKFDKESTKHLELLPYVEGTNTSCAFAHIFCGGYAAGYYGYKWAEVLDADAFELFKEKGIFNKEVAQSFKDNILVKGGSEPPMELYKKFRGRESKIEAFLKREGAYLLLGLSASQK